MWQIDCCWKWCIPQLSLLRRLGSVFVKPSGYQPNFFLLHLFFFFFSSFHLLSRSTSTGPFLGPTYQVHLVQFYLWLHLHVYPFSFCICDSWSAVVTAEAPLLGFDQLAHSNQATHPATLPQTYRTSKVALIWRSVITKHWKAKDQEEEARLLPMLAIIPNRTVVTLWLHWHCLGLCLCLLITLIKCLRGCNCKPLWSVVEGAVFVRDPDSGSFSSLAPSPVSLSVHHSVYHWHSHTRYLEVVLWGILGYFRTWHGVNHDLVH